MRTATQLPDEAERRQQAEEGAKLAAQEGLAERQVSRSTLRVRDGHVRNVAPAAAPTSKKGTPKGHEAFLKALETSGASVKFTKVGGETVEGVVKHSDKFTVSLRTPTGDRILFKHDISEFSPLTPRVVEKAEVAE